MTLKKISAVCSAPQQHWVGDGFPVRSLFSYHHHADDISPFLLLDYAGPMQFEATDRPRGVGEHPHRGFETVTIVYDGEVAHRDSTGAGGIIGPGDVQWMTAASGILHEEFHSPRFTSEGGSLEMVQLWVNLPAKDKMSAPAYQNIRHSEIPVIDLPKGAGSVRVIAGDFDGTKGAASTFTPVDVWDVRLNQNHKADFEFVEGRTLMIAVLRGEVIVNGEVVRNAEVAQFEPDYQAVSVEATSDTVMLVLSGEPIQEPVVGHGPFVMNFEGEIRKAVLDFNNGLFGQMP